MFDNYYIHMSYVCMYTLYIMCIIIVVCTFDTVYASIDY